MRIDDKTIYKKDFCDAYQPQGKAEKKQERQITKEMKVRMQAGSYGKSLHVPFQGESEAMATFKDVKEKYGVEKAKPFDEVSNPFNYCRCLSRSNSK